jgi:hypothetical protein
MRHVAVGLSTDLSGEYRTTRACSIRSVPHVQKTTDDATVVEPARWSIAGQFLEALTCRDYERLSEALDSDVRLRALLPPGPSEWNGRTDVVDVFRAWFGAAERFDVIDATVGAVAGRLQMTWRARVRPAPLDRAGWHLIEQHAFADIGETITTMDLVCSGFRAERTHPREHEEEEKR